MKSKLAELTKTLDSRLYTPVLFEGELKELTNEVEVECVSIRENTIEKGMRRVLEDNLSSVVREEYDGYIFFLSSLLFSIFLSLIVF